MFGNCLYGKFSNKCKHAFKCIKSRIGLIRKKKQAMIMYLKKDVAELLANGHDTNAFGRIDALIVEINHASCYDMIERYCDCISQQLPSLRKQRECPEEAIEAMATLIYAAARFSDLPELCNLRRMFTDRYGSQLESTTSREFVDKVQKKKFSVERKIQLMQYIAEEFSVSWDSKKFHQKISSNQPSKCSEKNDREEVYGDVDRDREVPYKVKWESARKSVVHREQIQPALPNYPPRRSESSIKSTNVDSWRNMGDMGRKERNVPQDVRIFRGPHDSSVKKTNKVYAAAEGTENVKPPVTDTDTKVHPNAEEKFGAAKPSLIGILPPYTKPNAVSVGVTSPKPNAVSVGVSSPKVNRHRYRHRRNEKRDEEEEAMDRLLLHYCKKGTAKMQMPAQQESKKRFDKNLSMPTEPTTPAGEAGRESAFARAVSMNPGRIVHPRLPDYDELAARFIALRKMSADR